MFKSHIVVAIRNLIRHRVFSTINIAGLSIGITSAVVILGYVRYESSFDSFQEDANRIYRVVQHTKFPEQTAYWNTTTYPLAEALRTDFSEFETVTQISGLHTQSFAVHQKDGTSRYEEKSVLYADAFYSSVFHIDWIAGDAEHAFKHPHSIVLTEKIAAKYFGDEAVYPANLLGRSIQFENKDQLIITGIVGDPPPNTNFQYSVLIPFDFYKLIEPYASANWSGNYQGTTFVVLSGKDQEERIEKKINDWKRKYLKPEDNDRIYYYLQPLADVHHETLYGSSPGSYVIGRNHLRAAVAIALFIVILASVNFVNSTTAQAAFRVKEVGVRKILGSSRTNLMTQFILENQLLITLTLLLSVGLVQVAMSQLNIVLTVISLHLSFGWVDFLLLIVIGFLVTVLASIYPSIVMASFKPADALKNKLAIGSLTRNRSKKALIVFQFAIVQFFIIATIVVRSQMHYFLSADQGLRADAIMTTPAPDFQKNEVFRQRLSGNSSIEAISFGSGPPMSVNGLMYGATFRTPQQPEQQAQKCEMKVGDLNYIDFYGLTLVSGRNFSAVREPYDEFIVNEKLIAGMGWNPQEALGRVLNINGMDAAIVGVVKDFHNTTLHEEILPCAIMNWVYFQDNAFIKVQAKGDLRETLDFVEKTWRNVYNDRIYSFSFLDDLIKKNYAVEGLVLQGLTIFSILAIAIGCLGLFGLMSFVTVKKTKEVGIRKVLGATATQILALFSREFAALIMIAFLLAAPLSFYVMEEWLSHFTYRIATTLWMFAGAGALSLLIAMLTVTSQSLKAALGNPIDALRNE